MYDCAGCIVHNSLGTSDARVADTHIYYDIVTTDLSEVLRDRCFLIFTEVQASRVLTQDKFMIKGEN